MERVSVARMATAKLQGWIHAARGMGVSGSAATELNRYNQASNLPARGEYLNEINGYLLIPGRDSAPSGWSGARKLDLTLTTNYDFLGRWFAWEIGVT
jgi:hypothetical protein